MGGARSSKDVSSVGAMPTFGFGTWENTDSNQCAESVADALDIGYRHVDTAQVYGNEDAVGDGIAAADVPREEVFLATKVWIENLGPDAVVASVERSLDDLNADSIDLLYVHWPAGAYTPEGTLGAFDELVDRGLVDRVGLSNFLPEQIDEATAVLNIPVFAHQVEINPLWLQKELRAYCDAEDIPVVAYSPLARGEVFDVPELTEIADKYGVSEAQVSLAWLREKGLATVPKATSEEHIRDNWRSLTLELDDTDVRAIDAIERRERQVDPDFAPW